MARTFDRPRKLDHFLLFEFRFEVVEVLERFVQHVIDVISDTALLASGRFQHRVRRDARDEVLPQISGKISERFIAENFGSAKDRRCVDAVTFSHFARREEARFIRRVENRMYQSLAAGVQLQTRLREAFIECRGRLFAVYALGRREHGLRLPARSARLLDSTPRGLRLVSSGGTHVGPKIVEVQVESNQKLRGRVLILTPVSTATESSNISLREVESFAELRAVEELQKEVWGVPDLDVVPLTHLIATKAAGGVLLGAFDGQTLVGFVYGFVAQEDGEIAHHSHMLAVKPAYRNFNLGYKLKLAQREAVLAQGIKLITWTFDPLQSLNAHFNFTKLGVISDRYVVNFYGEDAASFLHQTGTDRFWVKWLLTSDRVVQRLNSTTPVTENPSDKLLIEIPTDINSLQHENPEVAREWRERTRRAFTEAIDAGYSVLDFYREGSAGMYILGR